MNSKCYLSSYKQQAPKLRLFCFPYAGGSASIYREWQNLVPQGVEVIMVQPPGRAERLQEKPYQSIACLVEELGDGIDGLLDVPFIFFGHSLGGRIAFELAQKIKELKGIHPAHFIASASKSPYLVHSGSYCKDLSDGEMITKLRAMKGTPDYLLDNAELMALCLPFIRADFTMSESYVSTASYKLYCQATILVGDKDTHVSLADQMLWHQCFDGDVSTVTISGNHFFVNESCRSVVAEVSEIIEMILEPILT